MIAQGDVSAVESLTPVGVGTPHTQRMALSDRLALVLEEARESMRTQQSDLQAVRTNSASLLSAAGLVAGLLAALLLREGATLGGWSYVTLSAFALMASLVVFIHWPRKVIFSNDARVMLDEWDLKTRDDDSTTEYLAGFLADNVKANQEKVNQMTLAFAIILGLFIVEILALFIDLTTR